jgi:hypothetical protein
MFLQVFYVVFLMFIWFKTDAFIDYSKLFKLSKLFKIEDWNEYRIINPKIEYLDYLKIKKKSFFTKLIGCEYCLLFWVVLFSCIFNNNINYLPFIYVVSILIYRLLCKLVKF